MSRPSYCTRTGSPALRVTDDPMHDGHVAVEGLELPLHLDLLGDAGRPPTNDVLATLPRRGERIHHVDRVVGEQLAHLGGIVRDPSAPVRLHPRGNARPIHTITLRRLGQTR